VAETCLTVASQTSARFFTSFRPSTFDGFEIKPKKWLIELLYFTIENK